jgi:RNA polymerase sigma-70 factor (ECF subfamily)
MRRYHPILIAAAVRVSRQWGTGTGEETDDIVQEIYLRMCGEGGRVLVSFRDPRPEAIFGYLKVIATNIAHDFFRKKNAAKRGAEKTASVEQAAHLPAPLEDMDRLLSLSEIDEALEAHTREKENGRRDRIVFRLYYRYGLTAQGIAELPGIGLNPKGVEGVLHRLTKAVRQSFDQPRGLGSE